LCAKNEVQKWNQFGRHLFEVSPQVECGCGANLSLHKVENYRSQFATSSNLN